MKKKRQNQKASSENAALKDAALNQWFSENAALNDELTKAWVAELLEHRLLQSSDLEPSFCWSRRPGRVVDSFESSLPVTVVCIADNAFQGCQIAQRCLFFPRVRTPCGHGAQVIIEGREIQSDGGEEDKDNPTKTKNQNQTTTQRRSLHHPLFPLYWSETSETLDC